MGRFLYQCLIERLALILLLTVIVHTLLAFFIFDFKDWLLSPDAEFLSESFRYFLLGLVTCTLLFCQIFKLFLSYMIFKTPGLLSTIPV